MKSKILTLILSTLSVFGASSVFGANDGEQVVLSQRQDSVGNVPDAEYVTLFSNPATPPQVDNSATNVISNRKLPLFALKTNLLFDVAAALNVEVEVPFAKKWSVAGEWMFPWWLFDRQNTCFQVLSGNVEVRYWFKDYTTRFDQLTGWFAGVYAGGGLYDFEFYNKGYQGEFYIAAGLSGGYVHKISRDNNLRMEYSLGIGYLKTNYRQYVPRESDRKLIWQSDGRYTWVGPTRAKVSLIWMMDWSKLLKKGGRK